MKFEVNKVEQVCHILPTEEGNNLKKIKQLQWTKSRNDEMLHLSTSNNQGDKDKLRTYMWSRKAES